MNAKKSEPKKNKVVENRPVVEVKIDKKEPQPVVRMTRKKGEKLLKAYKAQCAKFPVRMKKYERKEKNGEFKRWLEALPEK